MENVTILYVVIQQIRINMKLETLFTVNTTHIPHTSDLSRSIVKMLGYFFFSECHHITNTSIENRIQYL